jgi:hypothetical protein
MTETISDERAAALRDKCLNLAKVCRSGSGPASDRGRSRDSSCLRLAQGGRSSANSLS